MNHSIFLIAIGCIILLLAVIVAILIHHRRVIRKKNRALYNQMRENSLLQEEMSYIRMEKNIMEKMLKSKIDALVWTSSPDTANKKQ